VIVDALGEGSQILVLRKGGIAEGPGGFGVEHQRFLLFPTLFHQQRESVTPEGQARFDLIAPRFPPADQVRIECWAEVAEWRRIESPELFSHLSGQHVWRDEVIAGRFDWGPSKGIFAIALRVHRLDRAVELPMRPGYGGCLSWVDLELDVETSRSRPALSSNAFQSKLEQFQSAFRIRTPEAARARA
jgi:hypothetical protein